MPDRTAPYPGYNYLVDLKGPRDPEKLLGGFSDVSGLVTEIHVSDYRDGNEVNPHVRKIPGAHTVGKVVLKRGVVDSSDLWAWISATRTTGVDAQRDVTITLRDEAGNPVQLFKLINTVPSKYTGPTLSGKGAGDVAMEELELTPEGFEVSAAS
ncbi:MAG TPA: phage tail protein [Candidatus Elarobacter sp.]|jgi:phage tail-like protein|nr:phage tail protein [Candidatus Elarobacter sp.]